jgi:hypothetical protein
MVLTSLKSTWACLALLVAVVWGVTGLPQSAPVAVADQQDPAPAAGRFRASVGEATIEVVAVSSHPTGSQTWWAPDGTPLAEAPADPVAVDIGGHEGDVLRVILVRVSGVQMGDTLKWLPTHDGNTWGGTATRRDRRVPCLEYYVASFRPDRRECDVQAKVATGPWTAEARNDGRGGTSFLQGGHKFYFGKARPFRVPYGGLDQLGTAISVGQNIVGRDLRLVALDRDDKTVHTPVWMSGAGGEVLSLLDAEFRVPPDQIKSYAVQARDFVPATIRQIALNPGSDRPEASPALPVASGSAGNGDADSDGDGLSDYQEVHKYRTDPTKFSTAGDGVSDGDWQRRREFAYTVRSVVKVMPPVNEACLNDDYQDARVLSRGPNFVELEVIHYPLNTNAEAIRGNPEWRQAKAGLEEYLRPGVTTNWDEAMRRELVAALRADGIDPDRLDDKALVQEVAQWLFAKSQYKNMFTTHYIAFTDGRAAIYPGLERQFETDKGDSAWSVQEQLERDLFGRSMFATRTHGSCTSSAVYLTTAMKALGIPTRMVLAIPLADGNDADQLALVRNGLHHHKVRQTVFLGVGATKGYSNHTFNEVHVGGRWVRLNYSALGQNILDVKYMGLLTHVNTFADLSEAGLAATWGKRYALGERDEVFRFGNPYRAIEVTDQFGTYAHIDNRESAAREHRAITLSRAYWVDADDAPEAIRKVTWATRPGGHVIVHGDEWFDDQPYTQYKLFMQAVDRKFLLRAEGRPDVHARITMSYVTHPPEGLREMELLIPSQELARMEPGVAYTLVPRNEAPGYQWRTTGAILIMRK